MGLIDIQSDIQVKCLVIKDKPKTLYLQGLKTITILLNIIGLNVILDKFPILHLPT